MFLCLTTILIFKMFVNVYFTALLNHKYFLGHRKLQRIISNKSRKILKILQ